MQMFVQKNGSVMFYRELECGGHTKFLKFVWPACMCMLCVKSLHFHKFKVFLMRLTFLLLSCSRSCYVHCHMHFSFFDDDRHRFDEILTCSFWWCKFCCSNECIRKTQNRLPTKFLLCVAMAFLFVFWYSFFFIRYVGKPAMLNFGSLVFKGRKRDFIFFSYHPNFVAVVLFTIIKSYKF